MNVVVEQLRMLRGAVHAIAEMAAKQKVPPQGAAAAEGEQLLNAIVEDIKRIEVVVAWGSGQAMPALAPEEPLPFEIVSGFDDGAEGKGFRLNGFIWPALLLAIEGNQLRLTVAGILGGAFLLSVSIGFFLQILFCRKAAKMQKRKFCPCCEEWWDGRRCEACGFPEGWDKAKTSPVGTTSLQQGRGVAS